MLIRNVELKTIINYMVMWTKCLLQCLPCTHSEKTLQLLYLTGEIIMLCIKFSKIRYIEWLTILNQYWFRNNTDLNFWRKIHVTFLLMRYYFSPGVAKVYVRGAPLFSIPWSKLTYILRYWINNTNLEHRK